MEICYFERLTSLLCTESDTPQRYVLNLIRYQMRLQVLPTQVVTEPADFNHSLKGGSTLSSAGLVPANGGCGFVRSI